MNHVIDVEKQVECEAMSRKFMELSPQQRRDTLMFMAGLSVAQATAQTAQPDGKSA